MISFSQKIIVAFGFQVRESKLRLSDLPKVTQLRPRVVAKVKVVIYHIIICTPYPFYCGGFSMQTEDLDPR